MNFLKTLEFFFQWMVAAFSELWIQLFSEGQIMKLVLYLPSLQYIQIKIFNGCLEMASLREKRWWNYV